MSDANTIFPSALTPDDIANRRTYIGGSDAARIMAGDWRNLYLEKRGEKAPDDLTGNLPVMLGIFTEPFNVFWFEKKTGRAVTHRNEFRRMEGLEYLACNLDGMTDNGRTVWDAKHTNPFGTDDDLRARYYAQMQHNMMVTDTTLAVLSCIKGNQAYSVIEIERDDDYITAMYGLERDFWALVQAGIEPDDAEVTIVAKVDETKIVDLSNTNIWPAAEGDWLANRDAAKAFKDAEAALKQAVPSDAKAAYGAELICTRDTRGSLRVQPITPALRKKWIKEKANA